MIYFWKDKNITLKFGTETVTAAYMGTEQVYPNVVPPIDYSMMYFTTEAIEDTVILLSENRTSFEVSRDNGQTWTTTGISSTFNLGLLAGEKAYWRCYQPWNRGGQAGSPNEYGIAHMDGTYRFKVYGNIMSLFWGERFEDKTTFPGSSGEYVYGLRHFFKNSSTLVDVQNLVIPVTEQYLCSRLFEGCSNLVNSPQLPSMNLAPNCYGGMFNTCTSLVTPPVLPATTMQSNCYNGMFYGCTSLVNAPVLPATTLAPYCYNYMFQGCTNLTTAPELPATTLVNYCYSSMFKDCTSLTTAPELPATTLVNYCYSNMFNGCTSLNNIKAMFTTRPTTSYTQNWVSGVSATGTFVKNSAATWNVTGVNGIPSGWTIQTERPKINKKYRATYSNDTTVDGDCDGNNLVEDEVTKSGLKTLVIGECVPAIVGECFTDCADLTSVIIEGNTSIDNYSFGRNNGHLTSITMYSTTPPSCQPTAFTYYDGSGYVPMTSITIYVPAESVAAYKAASGWSTYADRIQANN